MTWTDERVRDLKAYWAEGLSTAEIGRRLGITKNSVVGKVHRLNLPGRQSPIRRTVEPVVKPRPLPRSSGGCQWPIGDPSKGNFGFCGDRQVPGKPYCDSHCASAYTHWVSQGREAAA